MRYLLCFIFPPLAVGLCGKPVQAVLNFFLLFLFVVPAVLHGLLVVNSTMAEERNEELIRAMKREKQGATTGETETLMDTAGDIFAGVMLGVLFLVLIVVGAVVLFVYFTR
ncbi:MAG: YqaE/Pmp3 family membrane protein [Gemmataceae bacterium]